MTLRAGSIAIGITLPDKRGVFLTVPQCCGDPSPYASHFRRGKATLSCTSCERVWGELVITADNQEKANG